MAAICRSVWYAVNKGAGRSGQGKAEDSDASDDSEHQDFSQFASKKAQRDEKQKRQAELADMQKAGGDVIQDATGIRLPNQINRGITIDPVTGTAQ